MPRSPLSITTIAWLARCERRVWLELHGECARKVPDRPTAVWRATAGRVHAAPVMATMHAPAQPVEVPDWSSRVRETWRMLREGVAEIHQAGLEVPLGEARWLHGQPDVLRRCDQPSHFGPWSYEPVEIKQHQRARPHDRLQLDLYRWMLGELQGWVPDGELWLGAHTGVPTMNHRQTGTLTHLTARWQQIDTLWHRPEPPVAFARFCESCAWRTACDQWAAERQDIAVLTGLERCTADALRADGITTLRQVAVLAPAQLQRYPFAGPTVASHVRAHAQALLAGSPIRASAPQPPVPEPTLFLDLESDPHSQEPWAFGWLDGAGQPGIALVIPARPAHAPTRTLLAGVPVQFVRTAHAGWQHIAHLVERRPGQIFHWGDHEERMLVRSAAPAVTNALRPRMADLHQACLCRYTLPIPRGASQTSGTLKAVGAYVGQRWPADVDYVVAWMAYTAWRHQMHAALDLRHPQIAAMDDLLLPAITYLHADVAALRRIWQWLTAQDQEVPHA